MSHRSNMTLHIPPRMSSVSQYQHHHQRDRQETAFGAIDRAFDPYAAPNLELNLDLNLDLDWREHKGGFKDTEVKPGPGRAESCASDLTGGYSINRTGRLDEECRPEEHKVRPRLSSPFLRQSSRKTKTATKTATATARSKSKQEPLRPSESPSTSSFNRSQNSSTSRSYYTNGTSSQDLALRDYPASSQSNTDLSTDHEPGLTARKAKKQKHRPPMIDLSKLFPRPRKASGPCPPSPDRMASPPSVASNGSDASMYKTHKFDRAQRALNRLTRSPNPRKPEKMQSNYQQNDELMPVQEPLRQYRVDSPLQEAFSPQKDQSHQQQQRREKQKLAQPSLERPANHKYEGWRDPNFKRKKVSSAWYDGPDGQDDIEEIRPGDQIEVMYGQLMSRDHPPLTRDRRSLSLPSRQPSVQSAKPSQTNLAVPNDSTHRTPQKPKTSAGPVKQSSMAHPSSDYSQVTKKDKPAGDQPKDRPRIRKKSSRAILNSSNLNESSVLCLSSSEDESEDEPAGHTTKLRDSIATIDEGFQICTAQTVTAARRPSIKRVRSSSKKRAVKNGSTTKSQNGDQSRPSSLHPSTMSATESNYSSVPTIPEPLLPTSPPTLPRIQTQFSPAESQGSQAGSRRSRVMAVTRQEEYLLEMIRRNKGAMPQTLSPAGSATDTKEWAKALAVQINRRSISSYSSDTSFLRLSPALPPTPHQKRAPRSIPNLTPSIAGDATSSPSVPQSAASDISCQSPRLPIISLTNSGMYFPSPPSGQASPFTPTRPFKHRRHSSRLSQAPSMPSVREGLRNRANTSVLYDDNDDGEKDIETNPDIPIWALGWNSEATGIAIVH
ncbi:uncharacterized protein GIQ15_00050 [Arthroderma uncinatum]|uniref:uncharacterized protein n=1 Tax=Arthroderma uncinatum TaxID=74035 RepID=UPI00144AF528|nr:uncharacterized protein GIQ15_00050 [Arthroderma uncinatum]KAF3490533.1 hypothetical protein GIQ15_00050 [Arthroderma uncinatum]